MNATSSVGRGLVSGEALSRHDGHDEGEGGAVAVRFRRIDRVHPCLHEGIRRVSSEADGSEAPAVVRDRRYRPPRSPRPPPSRRPSRRETPRSARGVGPRRGRAKNTPPPPPAPRPRGRGTGGGGGDAARRAAVRGRGATALSSTGAPPRSPAARRRARRAGGRGRRGARRARGPGRTCRWGSSWGGSGDGAAERDPPAAPSPAGQAASLGRAPVEA